MIKWQYAQASLPCFYIMRACAVWGNICLP